MQLLPRALAGFVLAAIVSFAARRANALSTSGAGAALVVGTVACAAGWRWSAALLAFFISASLLSRWKRTLKEHRTERIVEKGGSRDLMQVVANGGVFTAAAFGSVAWPAEWWSLAALGSLAAATADTWATEVGTAIGGVPRTIAGWVRVPPGTSGAVSFAGLAASIAGAAFFGTAAVLAGFAKELATPVIIGGVAGALVDTAAGATIQERRRCPWCGTLTERRVHDCGATTVHQSGISGLGNDAVNVMSCLAGAGIALLYQRWIP